jgi:S1-C subfamily serine protease
VFDFEAPDVELMVPPPPGVPHPPLPPKAPRAPHAWSWKSDDGRDFAFKMLSGGPRKLGIEYMELGEQLASYFKLSGKSGVLVTAVDADGPAAKAGVKAGDVVLKLGGDAIADGGDLRAALREAEGGSEVAITLQRDGRPVELKVTLAKPEERRKRREARGVSL